MVCPWGFMDATRILAHILKDKVRDPDDHRGSWDRHGPENWSGFMTKSCLEALEALDAGDHVRSLKNTRANSGWKGFGKAPAGPPGPGETAPDPGDWYKGKGKSKQFHKGHR